MVKVGDTLVALFSHSAQNEENLSFNKDEVFVVTQIYNLSEWIQVTSAKGVKGIVPLNRLEDSNTLGMTWFCPNFDRSRAENLLLKQCNGTFLVRLSTKFIPDYTLSVVYNGKVEHYRIIVRVAKFSQSQKPRTTQPISQSQEVFKSYAIDEEKEFHSLIDLIEFYKGENQGLCCALTASVKENPRLRYLEMRNLKIHYYDIVLGIPLGKGEFAEVYKAEYKKQTVAVKTLLKSQNELALEMLSMEAYTMSQLHHPHIVTFYGFFKAPMEERKRPEENMLLPRGLGLVIEFMGIGSLEQYLQTRGRNVISVDMQLRFAKEVCSAMVHLEKLSFCHRDLAARNVLLNDKLVAKLSDFGLMVQDNTRAPETNQLLNSALAERGSSRIPIKWTAPEALKSKMYSNKTDVWSYGVLLWEIYTFGRLPYPNVPVSQVSQSVQRGLRLEPPNGCPSKMRSLMQECWKADPQERPSFHQIYQTFPS